MNAIKHFDIFLQLLSVFSVYIHLFSLWQFSFGLNSITRLICDRESYSAYTLILSVAFLLLDQSQYFPLYLLKYFFYKI